MGITAGKRGAWPGASRGGVRPVSLTEMRTTDPQPLFPKINRRVSHKEKSQGFSSDILAAFRGGEGLPFGVLHAGRESEKQIKGKPERATRKEQPFQPQPAAPPGAVSADKELGALIAY